MGLDEQLWQRFLPKHNRLDGLEANWPYYVSGGFTACGGNGILTTVAWHENSGLFETTKLPTCVNLMTHPK